jgi:hypothetical protein
VNTVVQQKVPQGLHDKVTHCIAAGMVARHCSSGEAYLVSIGKEIRDLFTPGGDTELADLRADYAGVGCARRSMDDAGLTACCEARITR